jgi:hypothetical protein
VLISTQTLRVINRRFDALRLEDLVEGFQNDPESSPPQPPPPRMREFVPGRPVVMAGRNQQVSMF